jgi:hypothetical protein
MPDVVRQKWTIKLLVIFSNESETITESKISSVMRDLLCQSSVCGASRRLTLSAIDLADGIGLAA